MSRLGIIAACVLIACLLLTAQASAQNFGAPWLRMGVGARAMAMGTAQTAVAEDATAAYWNPALLTSLHEYDAALMYTAGMKAERTYNYLSGTWNVRRIGGFGFSWMNAGITDIPGRDINRVPTGNFDVSQNAFQLTYARWLGSGVGVGVSGKYLQEDLADNNGYGLDLGALFKPYDELQFGAMIRDVVGKLGRDRTPFEARLGVGAYPWQNVTFDLDLVKVKDLDAVAALGGSYHVPINDQTDFYVAAGYSDVFRDSRGLTAGFGIGYRNLTLQYAYVTEPQAWLQENHRLSINFSWNERNPLASLLGSLKRKPRQEGPREIIHRVIIEGHPTVKLELEVLTPSQKDSITHAWAKPSGVVTFPGINFATGKSKIMPEFARVLDGIAEILYEHPEIELIEIQGHADSTGSDAINDPLSRARANAVRDYLIRQGVAPDRMDARGYGSHHPIASNATRQGRYLNRRIDIVRLK